MTNRELPDGLTSAPPDFDPELWEQAVAYTKEQTERLRNMPQRDPGRIPRVLMALDVAWTQVPDMRFGQLVECIAGCNQFYMEDEEMLDRIVEFGKGMAK